MIKERTEGVDGFLNERPIQVKKWSKPVGEVGSKFLGLVKKSQNRIGYFISQNGFSPDFKKEVRRA